MLLPQKKKKTQLKVRGRPKEAFGGNGYIYYIDCGSVSQVLTYFQTYQVVYIYMKYRQHFIYQSCFNKEL